MDCLAIEQREHLGRIMLDRHPFIAHRFFPLASSRPASFSVTLCGSSAARRSVFVCWDLVMRHVAGLSAVVGQCDGLIVG